MGTHVPTIYFLSKNKKNIKIFPVKAFIFNQFFSVYCMGMILLNISCNKGLGDLRPDFGLMCRYKIEFWNFEEKSIANSRYRSLLINSSTTIPFKLDTLPWQCSEKHRNTAFCNLGSIFHHSTSFSTTGRRDEQFLIMK